MFALILILFNLSLVVLPHFFCHKKITKRKKTVAHSKTTTTTMSNQRQQPARLRSSNSYLEEFEQQFQQLQMKMKQHYQHRLRQTQQSCQQSLQQLEIQEQKLDQMMENNFKLLEKISRQYNKHQKELQKLQKKNNSLYYDNDDTSRIIMNANPERNPLNLISVVLNQFHAVISQLNSILNKEMEHLRNSYPPEVDYNSQQQQFVVDSYHKMLDNLIKIGNTQRIAVTLTGAQSKTLSLTIPPPICIAIQQASTTTETDQSPVASPPMILQNHPLMEATLNGTKDICIQSNNNDHNRNHNHNHNHHNNNNINTNPFRKTQILASKQHNSKRGGMKYNDNNENN